MDFTCTLQHCCSSMVIAAANFAQKLKPNVCNKLTHAVSHAVGVDELLAHPRHVDVETEVLDMHRTAR